MPSEGQKKLIEDLERGLAELRERNQLRSLAEVAGISLCSNDYLGLAEDARLKEAVGLKRRGNGSRLSNCAPT